MEKTRTYENYPLWIVLFSNFVSLIIYALGFIILLEPGWIFAVLYLVFVLFFEIRLISKHCINCYYYKKSCGFGKGRVSALFFKKGDPMKFCMKDMTWKNMIPDILISLIPLTTGIILLIMKFDYIIFISLVLIIGLTTLGNGFVRGKLTCKYCKQKEMGCPADKLFNKEN